MKTKWFRSDLTGAPALDVTAGSIISVLDACLVNGFNANAVDSLTYDGATGQVTLTVNAGHGFVADQVIRVDGATDAAYNGDWPVDEVISPTELRYTPSAAPSQATAGGSITVKAAPLGWTKEFSGTNRAVYRAPSGLRQYLRVEHDTDPKYALVRAASAMQDVDTGDFWSRDNGFWRVSRYQSYTTDQWALVGDESRFYLTNGYSDATSEDAVYFFGDIVSLRPSDGGHSVLVCEHNFVEWRHVGEYGCVTNSTVEGWAGDIQLDYNQNGAQRCHIWSGVNDLIHPNAADNADHIKAAGEVIEDHPASNNHILRGYLPALYGCINGRNPEHGTLFNVSGRKFIALAGWSGNVAIEIATDWPVS